MKQTKHPEYQYLDLLREVLDEGQEKTSHSTGMGLTGVFGKMMRFDLSQGFPLLTTKKVFFRGIVHELIWFLSGSSNIRYLVENDVHIWDDWAYKNYQAAVDQGKEPNLNIDKFIDKAKSDSDFMDRYGELGPVYGVEWRRWPAGDGREIDQLSWAINKIKKYPDKKHILVSAWNPAYLYEMAKTREESMAIAPCHTMFHLNVRDGKLSLLLYQRSADLFLGVPFNIASYALLTLMIAQVTGFEPGEFVHMLGDAHIYDNHRDQVKTQLARTPKPFPTVTLNPKISSIDDFQFSDVTLQGYDPHPAIKGEITVVGGF